MLKDRCLCFSNLDNPIHMHVCVRIINDKIWHQVFLYHVYRALALFKGQNFIS